MRINMGKNLISKNLAPFAVTRITGSGLVDGEWVEGATQDLMCSLMITTMKKEEYGELNVGNKTVQVVKVRQLKSDTNIIALNDTFTFNGYKFKVIKEKLYMDHFNDFKVFYAISEADAIDK